MSSQSRKKGRKQMQVFSVNKIILQPSCRNHRAQLPSKIFTATSRVLDWNHCFVSTALRTPMWVLKFWMCSGPLSLSQRGPHEIPCSSLGSHRSLKYRGTDRCCNAEAGFIPPALLPKVPGITQQEKKQYEETWKQENKWMNEN